MRQGSRQCEAKRHLCYLQDGGTPTKRRLPPSVPWTRRPERSEFLFILALASLAICLPTFIETAWHGFNACNRLRYGASTEDHVDPCGSGSPCRSGDRLLDDPSVV